MLEARSAGEAEFLADFGRALARRRGQRKMSQADLAARIGVTRNYVSEVERGRRSLPLSTLERLSETLGLRPHQLLRDAWVLQRRRDDPSRTHPMRNDAVGGYWDLPASTESLVLALGRVLAVLRDRQRPSRWEFEQLREGLSGRQLASLRRGMTRDELSLEAGLGRTFVSRLETGDADPSLAKIWRLARAFDRPNLFRAMQLMANRRTPPAYRLLATAEEFREGTSDPDKFAHSLGVRGYNALEEGRWWRQMMNQRRGLPRGGKKIRQQDRMPIWPRPPAHI